MNILFKPFKLILALAALVVLSPGAVLSQASGNVSAGEFSGFSLVYDLSIPNHSETGATGAMPYTTNNSGSITPGSFDRIAYYLELDGDFIWVSMDAFTTDPGKIGVPTFATGAIFQQLVSNMNIESNVAGIVTGTGITTGNIEFWPDDYVTNTTIGGLGASGSIYDWDDKRISPNAGYGSMQVHNYGASQVLFAYNHWGKPDNPFNDDLGIGNSPSGHPDWTFESTTGNYTSKILQVYVRNNDNTLPAVSLSSAASGTVSGAFTDNIALASVEIKTLTGASLTVAGTSVSQGQTKTVSGASVSFSATGSAGNRIAVVITDAGGNREVWVYDFF